MGYFCDVYIVVVFVAEKLKSCVKFYCGTTVDRLLPLIFRGEIRARPWLDVL
jgi:hypothetical protein